MNQPDVSVIIPTYNRKEYLRKAVASCFEGNDEVDVEVVVVDDGSTDGTRDYLRSLSTERVRPIFQSHAGPQVARNRGMEEAKGTFIKFLDDDDWLVPGALGRERKELSRSGGKLSFGTITFVDEEGKPYKKVEPPHSTDLVAAAFRSDGNGLITLPLRFLYHESLVRDLCWDPSLDCRQDLAFFLSVALKDPHFVRIEDTVAVHRKHDGERVARANRKIGPRTHLNVLIDAAETMIRDTTIEQKRRKALAQGLWRWGHILAPYDWGAFKESCRLVERLVPDYHPTRKRRILGVLDTLLGPRVTERLLLPFRRLKNTGARFPYVN